MIVPMVSKPVTSNAEITVQSNIVETESEFVAAKDVLQTGPKKVSFHSKKP